MEGAGSAADWGCCLGIRSSSMLIRSTLLCTGLKVLRRGFACGPPKTKRANKPGPRNSCYAATRTRSDAYGDGEANKLAVILPFVRRHLAASMLAIFKY